MTTDVMPHSVQKEMMQDQLQKLSLENCTLLLENKLIKDKHSRAVAQNAELETRLKNTQIELSELQAKLENVSIHMKRTLQADVTREIELYKAKAATSAKEAEMLKSEISLLEEQLHTMKQEHEAMRLNVDKSKLHDLHKQEIQTLQDELAHLKHLLVESENAVQAESTKSKDCVEQLHKLTEIQELLQLQLEETNCRSNALEKQMEALQIRLHVTEERLTQERADRAGNLSHIEEKLLTENAKLQTKAKELDRQLKREKEKTRTFQQRANELREENLHLRLTLPDEEAKDYSIPYDRRNNSRKQAIDIKEIWKQLDSESSFLSSQGDMESLVLYLWDKCQNLQQQLKTWQLYLEQLEVPVDEDYFISLQNALAVKTEYEAKVQQTEEKLEDVSAEKITAEQAYKQQLTELIKEKHEACARVGTLEDLIDALKTENEALRKGLSKTPGHLVTTAKDEEIQKSQVETLLLELAGLQSNISQLTRRNKLLETEISTLQCQLTSRDRELAETFAELKTAQVAPKSNTADELFKQQKIESLTSEVASLKEEMNMQSEKHLSIQMEKEKLNAELCEIKDELQSVRKRNKGLDLNDSLTQKNQAEKMEVELEKKDEVILKLTTKLNENEISLSKAESNLKLLQKIHTNMETQLESMQYQLDQRCQLLDALSAKENDQVEQLEMTTGMIHTLNQRLTQKQGELESLQLQLQQASAKIAKLEEQSAGQTRVAENVTFPGEATARSSQLATELRLSEIKLEKEKLEAQLMQTTNTLASVREECETLNAEADKVKKDLSDAAVNNTKMTNEYAAYERRIQVLEEEKIMFEEERNTLKGNINRLESSLQEVISKLESDSKCQLKSLSTEDIGDSLSELENTDDPQALHLLMFAKFKENNIIMEKLKCQEQELTNLEKVCELLHRENQQNRADVNRMTNELVVKIRENAATVALNRVLLREQASLQKQLVLAEKHLEQERDRAEQRKNDVSEIIKKIEHSEQVNLATSVTLQQKDSVISDQEVRLRQLNLDLSQTEAERDRLKAKVDELKESMRSLSSVNTGLESTILARDAAIRDEQSVVSRQKEELLTLSHKVQVLEHEQVLMLRNVSSEKKVQEKFQENIKTQEECIQSMNKKLAELTQELELQKGYLVAAKETIHQTKVEKESIMKDYHDVCRRLGEKETILLEMQKKTNEEITLMKQEVLLQSQAVNIDKVNSERDVGHLKSEIEDLKSQLQRKESQVSSFGQTLKDLEDAQRKITSLESYSREQENIASETKLLIESLRSELFSLRDQNAELHDTIARKEVVILDLKDQLRHSGESSESQVVELRHTIDGMRSHYEFERKSMREAHNKVEENLKSCMRETLALRQAHDSLTEELRSQEKLLAEARHKLSQEEIARKFAEDKLSQHQEIVDDLRRKKTSLEEAANKQQLSLNKTEADHSVMQERVKHLTLQLKNLEMVLKERESQNESLKADVVRHQQMLETHRQQSASELQVLDLKLKQKVDSKEKGQMKLMNQAHQLSVDLEQARETIVLKNKENLKLQEQVLELENHLREGETKLRHTENTLKQEEEIQTNMITRFQEQDSELKKLRNFLAKKAEEGGDGKGMWQEMNHMLSELSHQLQFHIETSRLLGQGGKDDGELVHRLRRSLMEAESRLNTERALHAVTRSSMQALEEDCTRLRQTILTMRRHGASKEKKQKSRMEEINEIIARSQTRAQALLASGEFNLDGSLRNLSPSRDYSVADTSFSPDTSFASDASFGAAHLANLSFLNLSGNLDNYNSPRK